MENQIFNKEAALQNLCGSEDMLAEIIQTFISKDIDEQSLQALCALCKKRDIAGIFRKTHNLKSSSAYAGASILNKAIIELLEFSRKIINSVLISAYQKINDKYSDKITQNELDNASEIVELKKTITPVSLVIEQNSQELYEKFVFHIAEELLLIEEKNDFAVIDPMHEKILKEAQTYKETVQKIFAPKS